MATSTKNDKAGLSRRKFLRRLAKTSAVVGGSALAARVAWTQDTALQSLMEQNQRAGEFGLGFDSASRSIPMPKTALPTLSPLTVQTTEQAIRRYETIVGSGGWPIVPSSERLRLGNRSPAVITLRQRLAVAGDLGENIGVTDVYDSYVEAAVRRFQARHGLAVDGQLREQTYNAMNIPAPTRLSQLRNNFSRLRSLGMQLGNRYVVCNIPAAQVEAVETGTVVSRHIAVVGKPDRPSPDINSKIVEINFNPYWTVPVSIVRRDLIPKMQEMPDYLTSNRIRIFDPRGNELTPAQINWYSEEAVNYQFKQDPGDFNSLGSIRINFPNRDGVYMHDTPYKNLFGEDFRFHSSGCIRIQNVRDLVNWLLIETPGWPRQQIDAVVKSGERVDAKVAKPVPLYWVYITGWATPDGIVQFRDDIYNKDSLMPAAVSRG